MEQTELNQKIMDLIQDGWVSEKRPLLLSQLGAHDRGEIAREIRTQYRVSLSGYIEKQLSDTVKVVRHSTNPVITGAVPKTPETESIDDFDDLLEKNLLSHRDEKKIRFHPIFWAAFRRAPDPGKKRYLSLGNRLEFWDVGPTESVPGPTAEIQDDYFPADGQQENIDQIYKRIQNWAESNNITLDRFSLRGAAKIYSQSKTKDITEASMLDYFFKILNENDLKRINMPMDIVEKLSRTRI